MIQRNSLWMTIYIYIYISSPLVWWVECLLISQEARVQSQIESYQRFKIWYLMLACLLNKQHYKIQSKVESYQRNQGKGEAPSPTHQCCSYWKRSLQVALDNSHQLYLYIYINHIFYINFLPLLFFLFHLLSTCFSSSTSLFLFLFLHLLHLHFLLLHLSSY